MARRSLLVTFLFSTIFLHSGNPQTFDCPSDWYTYRNTCYQFYGDSPKSYEKARFHCSSHGAGLLSIDDRREHDYISRWLQVNDKLLRNWYTSGIREITDVGVTDFVWQGTGNAVKGPDQFWAPDRDFNTSVGVIIYSNTEFGYLWSLADPAQALPYVCEVPEKEAYRIVQTLRDYDYGQSSVDVDLLEKGPRFLVQPHSKVVVGNPETAELECVATGNPDPVYTWWKGQKYQTRLTSEMDSRYTMANGKLIIANPQEGKDNDRYRCSASNKFGTVISTDVQLTFGGIGEFSNVKDQPVNARAYKGAAIECSRITYKPAVKYQWFKHNSAQFVRPEYQDHIFISQNGKLYFSEVTSADEGQYHCLATVTGVNRFTISTYQPPSRTSLPISLHVHDQTAIADWGPQIQDEFIAVFPKPPMVGYDIRMECFAYGTSRVRFIYGWRRANKPLPESSTLMDHGRVLLIRDAQLKDQGIYTCTVSRGTSARDEKSIDLVLGAKPYFITPIKNQHTDIGSQLTWRCDARSNPAATYQWLKNGVVMKSDPEKFIKINSNILLISKLDPKLHDGMYQCAATNVHGTSLSGGQLRVLAFAPNFIKNPMPDNTRVSVRGNLTLICRPEGAPLPVITWLKDGIEIPDFSDNVVQDMNGYLRINNINKGAQGKYTCRANNSEGQADDSTYVSVVEGTTITVPPQDQTVVVNASVFVFCHASHAPNADIVYDWLFNGRKIDFYRNPEYRTIQEDYRGKTGLYIQSVSLYNEGYYECMATSTFNSDKKKSYLTVIGTPSEPGGVAADSNTVTTTSAVIRWMESSDNGRTITNYLIEAANEFEEDHWEIAVSDLPAVKTIDGGSDGKIKKKRFANVTGLNPGCGYKFRVIAINAIGRSPPSIPSAFIQTLSAAPIVPPMHVGGGGGSVGLLTMTWEPLSKAQQAGPGIGYRLYWKKHNSPRDALWNVHEVKGNVGKYVDMVGVMNFYLEYDFKIQAFNDLGYGPNSSVHVIMSAEDLPIGTPTNVYADGYNGTAMEVVWTPVPQLRRYAKGKILGYQINYWHETEVATDYKEFIRHEGQVDMGIVIGLKSDNFYYFTIQVYNSAGLGPVSEYFTQETLHAPASQYPEEIRVYSAGGHRVKVWWRGIHISQPESNIHGFVIYYWPANENYRTACHHVVHDHHADHDYIDVDPGVVYAIRVSAYSDGGYGKKSLTTYFTLEGKNVLVDTNLAQTVEAFRSSSPSSSPPVVTFIIVLLVSFLLMFSS